MKTGYAIKIAVLGTGTIAAGTLIYLCFRPTSLTVFDWINAADLTSEVLALRGALSSLGPHIPEVLLSSLPGALWAFAFALTMGALWSGAPLRWSIPFLSTVPLMALGSEAGQGLGLLPGTYDPVDLLFYTIAILIGFSTALAGHDAPHQRPT